jgi:hypothetical protein
MMSRMVFTVQDVCEACQCSRAWVYLEWKGGRGPTYFLLGSRRRVLKEDLETWLQSLKAGVEVVAADKLIPTPIPAHIQPRPRERMDPEIRRRHVFARNFGKRKIRERG